MHRQYLPINFEEYRCNSISTWLSQYCGLRRIYFILFFLLLSNNALAIELTGEGYGKTETVAREQALSALSESIYVDIVSEYNRTTNNTGELHASKRIHSHSDVPLHGVDFTVHKSQDSEYLCRATLSSDRAGKVYQQKLTELFQSIKRDYTSVQQKNIAPQLKYDLWLALQTQVEQYKKLQNVALLLGVKSPTALPVSEREIRLHIDKLETVAESLAIAASVLTRKIDEVNIYVLPPTFQEGYVITPLARLLKNYISKNLQTASDYASAEYIYKGNYEQDVNGLYVRYKLLDKQGNTLHTRSVKLAQKAYEGVEYKTSTQSFEQLLHQGYVVNNNFRVDINTDRGKEDLLLEKNQLIRILIKLNQPGYFYVVGHTLNNKNQMSYLLELMQTSGNRKFVRYVNADDVNKWISLGEFNADPPFGVENLQVIASNEDLIYRLPAYHYDRKKDYYIIDTSVTNAVNKVRSLKPNRDPKNQHESSEAVLTFTTMSKTK